MDELTVIGAEDGALIVVTADGARFRLPITEALHTAIRQNRAPASGAHRTAPREIQALIRQGMTAAEVAAQTGEDLAYIQRFEGPVLAEREYVVTAARGVPVAVVDAESSAASTFGGVIDRRLSSLAAREVRWASRKVDSEWLVSVAFIDGETARTAVWSFDPKRSVLAPGNHEARSLSQQGETAAPVLPRLRAVPAPGDGARFDSGAFAPVAPDDTPAVSREDSDSRPEGGNTADLLEALRRRRGERESAAPDDWESARAAHPSTGSIRIVEIPLDAPSDGDLESAPADDPHLGDTIDVPVARPVDSGAAPDDSAAEPSPPASKPASRRGRAAMPSWDEIVFGARPDDDPA